MTATVSDIMGLVATYIESRSRIEQYFSPNDRLMQMNTADNYRRALELALTALVEERDQAHFALEMQAKALGPNPTLPSFIEQATGWLRERDTLIAENEKLKVAVAKCPETYQYVEDDDRWHGQEFCWFCGGEMASQRVNHKKDCIWVQSHQTAS